MNEYIDPISDVGFKLLFGREKISEPVLMDFLNAILGNSGPNRITSLKYLNSERQSDWNKGKGIRYDILCETASKERYIVEMQKASQPNFIDRATYYVARGVAEQGSRGKARKDTGWDYSLKPVIGIYICNFHVSGLDARAVVRASTLDEDTFKPIGAKTRYIFVQLPLFDKEEADCENIEDQWIYNIKNMGIRQEVAFRKNSDIFNRLAEVANVATLSPAERRRYDADIKNARDSLNQIRGAYQDGKKEGHIEGRAEGRAEGIEHVAVNLIRMNWDDTMIASATGLSAEQVHALRNQS